jgi:zinc protease
VNQEYHEFTVTPPYALLYREVIPENALDRMPQRRPVIGVMEDLASATLNDALAFHEAYYGPDTASLFVAGNFDQAQLDGWVDKYLGPIPRRPRIVPLEIERVEPPRLEPRRVERYVSNVAYPAIATSWKLPPYTHPDLPVVEVIDAILTRGRNSRLHRRMISDRPLATQIGTLLNDLEDVGHFTVVAQLAEGTALEEAEATLAAEILRIREKEVSEAELREAKNELIAASLRQRETPSNRAVEMAEALVRSGDPGWADKRLAAIQKVEASDVRRAAQMYLDPQRRVDIRYLSEKNRPAGTVDAWRNPVPMPRFSSVPSATRPPNKAAEEAKRDAPPAAGEARPVARPALSTSHLPNSLTVVTAKTTDVPIASIAFVLRAGAASDPTGKAGLANLVAELATRGTSTRSAQEIAAEIESLGATLSSSADPDGIVLSVSAPAATLEAAGKVLADIVQNATFPANEFEPARKRALDRFAVSMKDTSTVAALVAQRALYGDAPYGSIPSGTAATLAAITPDDLLQHYRNWWHPSNAAVVIAGGIDPAAASALAAKLFGPWSPTGTASTPPSNRAGSPPATRTIVIDIPNSAQTAVVLGVRGLKRADPAYYDILAANSALGAGTTSRLFQEIRSKRGLSYSTASWMADRADDSTLTAWAQTKSERAAELLEVMLGEFGRMSSEPLSDEWIETRKALMSGHLDRQIETSAGFANGLASLVRQGLPPEEIARSSDGLARVTGASATAIAQRIFSPAGTTVVVVGDASKVLELLKTKGRKPEVIPVDQLDLDSPTLRRR